MEDKGVVSVFAGVKLGSLGVVVLEPAGVVHGDAVSFGGNGARANGRVFVLQSGFGGGHEKSFVKWWQSLPMEAGVGNAAAGHHCRGLFCPMPFAQGVNYAADKKRQAVPVFWSVAGLPAKIRIRWFFSPGRLPILQQRLANHPIA